MHPNPTGQPVYQQPGASANFGGVEGGSFDVETMAALGLPPNTYVVRIDSIEPGLTQDKTKTKLQFNATNAQATATAPAGKKHVWSETNVGILTGNLVRAGIRGQLPSNVQQLAQHLNAQMAGRFYIISVVQQKKDPSRTNTSISSPYDPNVGMPQTQLAQQPPAANAYPPSPAAGPPPMAAAPVVAPPNGTQPWQAPAAAPASSIQWPAAPAPVAQPPMPPTPQPIMGAPVAPPNPAMQQPPPPNPAATAFNAV